MSAPGLMDYGHETYGAEWAADYDQIFPDVAPGMIDRLVKLANGGRVLELAIGTGRIALPLKERGVDIAGIDISPEMVGRLQQKPGGSDIPVVMGDFADVEIEGKFAMIYLIFNTLFGLADQSEQVRCFQNVASHLNRGGRFVIEAFYPDLGRFDRGQRVQANRVERGKVTLDVSKHDAVNQLVTSQWIELSGEGVQLRPVVVRYSWPSELDLMGRLAGLELEGRWGGWEGEPFTAQSPRHVSVYRV
ncbi:MAG TPA: class I SAM-dependent methyltransferase, partial [Acidimicrobiia bacterium]|nr:class I SAM-dependent methyltransferase [Acidimicrobiia bacterium]